MASVLAEYFRSVFIKRRFTVITATSLFIVPAVQWLFNHLSSVPSDLRKASVWEAPWWLWALSIVCCIVFASFLAWCDEHRQRKAIEKTLSDREEDHRSERTVRDSLLILYARSPGASAEVMGIVSKVLGAGPIRAAGESEKTTRSERRSLQSVGATLRVRIPDGDVLIGDIKLGRRRAGRYLTAKVLYRIQSSFTQTATILIRINGQLTNTSVSIPASTSGTAEDVTNPFLVPLPEGINLIEIQAILVAGDKEYTSDSYPFLIGD
ncbi:MAG: hypothetical protein ACJ74Z_20960 [Bryobacteraceae bacterium]